VIIDSSALVAILTADPGARQFTQAIKSVSVRRLSAASYVETAAVIDGRKDPILASALDRLITMARIEIVPFTVRQATLARDAYQRFGRGSGHPAWLNLGDCFSYALARDLGEPLLFKGADFALTDIEMLVEPVKSRRLSEVLTAYDDGPAG
jgi:ribonuclease VapC